MNDSSNQDIRLAMWSGPRNISTAMMRAWENRADTRVWDEPFYAYYLQATGLMHPMRDEIISAGIADWRKVVEQCVAKNPQGVRIHYQKHMTHHMLPEIADEWLDVLEHCFLIRDPALVVRSYLAKREHATLADIGIERQWQLFDQVCQRRGSEPLVIDSADFLKSPEAYLRAICSNIGVNYNASMVDWPAGPRGSDGIWASHWYAAVWQSTGFQPAVTAPLSAEDQQNPVASAAAVFYQRLHTHRLLLD